jgi:hypothetical protein
MSSVNEIFTAPGYVTSQNNQGSSHRYAAHICMLKLSQSSWCSWYGWHRKVIYFRGVFLHIYRKVFTPRESQHPKPSPVPNLVKIYIYISSICLHFCATISSQKMLRFVALECTQFSQLSYRKVSNINRTNTPTLLVIAIEALETLIYLQHLRILVPLIKCRNCGWLWSWNVGDIWRCFAGK